MRLKRAKIQIFYDRGGMRPKILKSAEARYLLVRAVFVLFSVEVSFCVSVILDLKVSISNVAIFGLSDI